MYNRIIYCTYANCENINCQNCNVKSLLNYYKNPNIANCILFLNYQIKSIVYKLLIIISLVILTINCILLKKM